jgi:hypothetical protein
MIFDKIQSVDFCQRWLDKAASYDTTILADAFDKYFTLFVVFNYLYAYMAPKVKDIKTRDRLMATQIFPEVVGYEYLYKLIWNDPSKDDIDTLRNLIRPDGEFYLISDRETNLADNKKNEDLYKRLGDPSHNVAVKALLEYLYLVRCNMVHGSKEYDNYQLQILQPCIRCLELVVQVGLKRIKENTI